MVGTHQFGTLGAGQTALGAVKCTGNHRGCEIGIRKCHTSEADECGQTFFDRACGNVRSKFAEEGVARADESDIREAAAAGVRIMAWDCAVTPETLGICRPVPVLL